MRCRNFDCTNEAAPGWPCCDQFCGYHHRQNLGAMKYYQEGRTHWKYLHEGLFHYFTLEQCEYYHRLLNK